MSEPALGMNVGCVVIETVACMTSASFIAEVGGVEEMRLGITGKESGAPWLKQLQNTLGTQASRSASATEFLLDAWQVA